MRAGLVGGGGDGGEFGGGTIEIEDAGDELTERAAEMAEDALLKRGVILRAAEQVGEKLAEDGVALEELHHARGDGAAEERSAVETADEARGEFEFGGKRGFDTRGIFFGAAFGEGLAQEFAGAHGVEQAFAG